MCCTIPQKQKYFDFVKQGKRGKCLQIIKIPNIIGRRAVSIKIRIKRPKKMKTWKYMIIHVFTFFLFRRLLFIVILCCLTCKGFSGADADKIKRGMSGKIGGSRKK